MKKRRLLTKEYLQFLGINDVLEDGTIIGAREKPIKSRDNGKGYKITGFNRIELGKPFNLYNHHIIWTWFNGTLEPNQEVHHLDRDRANNALSNLIALSHEEHIRMHRLERIPTSVREMKCQMTKHRSYYEEKLNSFLKAREQAIKDGDEALCTRLNASIYNTRARLRYWDAHEEERKDLEEFKKKEAERLEAKRQSVKDRRILTEWKEFFREKGNKKMWKELIRTIKAWDTLDSKQKERVFEILHKTFGNPWAIEL